MTHDSQPAQESAEQPEAAAPEEYRTKATSSASMTFDPVKLEKGKPAPGERTRRMLEATGVRNLRDATQSLKATIVYQKKHRSGTVPAGHEYENLERIPLTSIQSGHELAITLSAAQTSQLLNHLQNMYAIANDGIAYAMSDVVVISGEAADALRRTFDVRVASPDQRSNILDAVLDIDPQTFDIAAHHARDMRHRQALAEFEENLARDDWTEGEWEEFFQSNRWIFGHGLAYQFLSEIQSQPHYGGVAVTGRGAQKGDHIMATGAENRFTVLVEVKTPGTDLVLPKAYRNGVHQVGPDVAGGASQLQVNSRTWALEGSRNEANSALEDDGIYTVAPRGILVVGNTASLGTREMRNSFELFRRSLHNPEIITFDELLARATYIVGHDLAEHPTPEGATG